MQKTFTIIFVVSLLAVTHARLPSDAGLNIIEMVTNHGYPVECHEVQTEDDYILTLHRIPRGRGTGSTTKRPPVLLMHGLMCSSAEFVVLGPTKSLGFLLADAGYDVWLANNRGNTWSRKHKKMDPDLEAAKFFNFSFHEVGLYDLPACIDYILEHTEEQNLFYIGHSQGTTSFFAMLSERPDYNNKIRLMIALSPVIFDENVPSPLFRFLSMHLNLIMGLVHKLHLYELFPHKDIITAMGLILCADGSKTQQVCANLFYLVGGYNPSQLNSTTLSVIYSGFPAGMAAKQLFHILQIMRSGQFCKFDYGLDKNVEYYGTSVPPKYNLSRAITPVIAYYSENDLLLSPSEAKRFARELPNLKALKLVNPSSFTHLDFVWGNDVDVLLNNDIIAEMRSLS